MATRPATEIGLGPSDPSSYDAEAAEHFLNAMAHAGQNRAVAPPADVSSNLLACLQYEYPIFSGASAGADLFDGGWRYYAQASYGPEGSSFTERLHSSPEPDALAPALAQLVESISSCR